MTDTEDIRASETEEKRLHPQDRFVRDERLTTHGHSVVTGTLRAAQRAAT